MAVPMVTLSWAGYNLFRLAAVGIMAWALVIHFIALSDDMTIYSETLRNSSTIELDPMANVTMPQDSYYGASAVPNQQGGPFGLVCTRLLIALTLAVLIPAQIGIPESFWYHYVSWLGPQSSPMCLGSAQVVLAIVTLSLHTSSSLLSSSWGLLNIGVLNILLAAILLWLAHRRGRKIPTILLFSLHHRLTYWVPPPDFYLRQPHTSNLKDVEKDPGGNEVDGDMYPTGPSGTRSISVGHHQQSTRAQLPSRLHTANTLQVAVDGPEEDWQRLEGPARKGPPRMRPSHPVSDVTDVTKGGYPTFSGMGMATPGRNVPSGHVAETVDGRVEFRSEPEETVLAYLDHKQAILAQPPIPQVSLEVKDKDTKRTKPPPLIIDRPGDAVLAPPPSRGQPRRSTTQPAPRPSIAPLNIKPRRTRSTSQKAPSVSVLTPIGEDEPGSATTVKHSSVHSSRAAAAEIAPRFPLPPSRLAQGRTVQDGQARSKAQSENIPTDGTAQPGLPGILASKPTPLDQAAAVPHHTDQPSQLAPGPPAPEPTTTPRSNEPEEDEISPTSAKLSARLAAAKSARISKGVRFDLSSPRVAIFSPQTSISDSSAVGSVHPVHTPKSPLSAVTSKWRSTIFGALTPSRRRPESPDLEPSSESAESSARPESLASTVSTDSEADVRQAGVLHRDDSMEELQVSPRRSSEEKAGLPRRKDSVLGAGRREGVVGTSLLTRPKSVA